MPKRSMKSWRDHATWHVCDRNNIGRKPDLVSGINRKSAYKGMPKHGQNGLCTIA